MVTMIPEQNSTAEISFIASRAIFCAQVGKFRERYTISGEPRSDSRLFDC